MSGVFILRSFFDITIDRPTCLNPRQRCLFLGEETARPTEPIVCERVYQYKASMRIIPYMLIRAVVGLQRTTPSQDSPRRTPPMDSTRLLTGSLLATALLLAVSAARADETPAEAKAKAKLLAQQK